MNNLPYVFWLNHLTEVGCKWREVDFDTRAIVRGLKQEGFNGYLEVRMKGGTKRFTSQDIDEFIAMLLPVVGEKLRDDIKGPISIVPIPNSGMASGVADEFRCVELAKLVAKGFGPDAEVCAAVVWDKPREKSHKKNEYRHPDLYEPHMQLAEKPNNTVVLFDDVLTSGSQMIAAARMLTKAGFPPALGLVVARATKAQVEGKVFEKHNDELKLARDPFDFNGF